MPERTPLPRRDPTCKLHQQKLAVGAENAVTTADLVTIGAGRFEPGRESGR
jgi:hypothetical protein